MREYKPTKTSTNMQETSNLKEEILDALETLRSVLTFKEVLAISKRIGERMKGDKPTNLTEQPATLTP